MTETEFQAEVIKLAKLGGWKHYHTYNSRRSVAGFPDLVLVHRTNGRIIFAELKTATGRVSPPQREWLELLGRCHESLVWRPADLDSGLIRRVLLEERRAVA